MPQIQLNWARRDNIGVVGYDLDYSASGASDAQAARGADGWSVLLDNVLQTGYAHAAEPSAGEVYYYRLRARDAAGNVSAWSMLRVGAPLVPVSKWSKSGIVPRADLEAWHALDGASGPVAADFSGNNRPLAANSANPPVLRQAVINGCPGVYFDGATSAPLTYAGNVILRHAFIVASAETALFPVHQGLLSDRATNPVLIGVGGSDKFFDLGLSGYGGYRYLKNYVEFSEAGQTAPMANRTSIIEIVFPPSLALDGIQIGQDRNLTSRKWKGYFIESLIYSRVKNDCERRDIYRYLALKFRLWRRTAGGLNIFPFPNDRKTPGQSFVNELSSTSISGAYKARTKSGLIRRFDVPFTARRQDEWDAAEAFYVQNRNKCVLDDTTFHPSRQFVGRMTTGIDRDPQSLNNWGYKFGFITL